MTRFDCNSKLIIKPSLVDRTLSIKLYHRYHTPYQDIHMTPDVLSFVDSRVFSQTPSEIYHNLQKSGFTDIENIVQHQVYYQWQQANKRNWRRHDDQFISATKLLEELGDNYIYKVFEISNIRALGIYIRETIDLLSATTKEIAIDATYGTNSAGMQLFAVLAELDGTGVPLAYLFVEKDASCSSAFPGTLTQILDQYLRYLSQTGLVPAFVGCDKDKAEINAIQQVWPFCKVQLCFWHAKRAIQSRLKESKRSDPLAHYMPGDAKSLIPSLEICWGSHPTKRSDRNHRYEYIKLE